jgi:elongation factor Ts
VAQISAAEVKALREQTGAGMMDCKRALIEAEGDAERAMQILRERGLVKARGKAGRATLDGLIVTSVSDDGRRAAIVEVNCETDFVAKTADFTSLAADLARLARDQRPADAEALLALSLDGTAVRDRVLEVVAKLGENIQVRRVAHLEAGPDGRIGCYVHAGGKLGTLVQIDADASGGADAATLVHQLCLHVTAANPLGVSRDDLPAADVERERAVLETQARQEGKPDKVVPKIVEGRLGKFFKEMVLLEQPLVMDAERTVEEVLKAAQARVVAFRRFQLGEEIEA